MELRSSGLLAQALQHRESAQTVALQQRLAHLQARASGPAQEIQQEATELASLFIFQVLQAMRRTVPKSELLEQGFAHDLYHSFFDQEVARHIARREDLGLTSLLMQQFRPQDSAIRQGEVRLGGLEAYQQSQLQAPASFLFPVQGQVSSSYGWRQDPFDQEERFHHGLDIAVPAGALVRAAAPGRVIFSDSQQGYGQMVILAHQDGYQTYYAHNVENLVAVGDHIRRGQPIARVGQSGRVTGPHLHFEIRRDGSTLDPSTLLDSTTHTLSKVKFSPGSTDR